MITADCPPECIAFGECTCFWGAADRARNSAKLARCAAIAAGALSDPPVSGGLMIEGIATTRGWDADEDVHLPQGLKCLDGSTSYKSPGRDPMKMKNRMPLPLLWRHNWTQRIGEMVEVRATPEALHFSACIVPPGTTGYDTELLRHVWADVKSGDALGVSFAAKRLPNHLGEWEGHELSVCPRGANPAATIHRALFPDGEILERRGTTFTDESTRAASKAFHNAHRAPSLVEKAAATDPVVGLRAEVDELRKQLAIRQTVGDGLMRYAGVWSAGLAYKAGDVCTYRGLIWHANEVTTAKPGTGATWTMMLKSEDVR